LLFLFIEVGRKKRTALVFDQAEVLQAASPHSSSEPAALLPWRRGRVLLVTSQRLWRDTLAEALRRTGCEVLQAPDRDEAVRQLGAEDAIDLVLSDAELPGQGGVALLAWLRRRDWVTPFVLLAHADEPHAELAAWKLGVTQVLRRPFSLPELVASVLRFVPAY
jgi:DNA-binding response OmpR family regulator